MSATENTRPPCSDEVAARMRVLAYTQIFPSHLQPEAGAFNLRTFAALSKYAQVDVIAPRAGWRYLKGLRNLVISHREQFGNVSVTYPNWWSVPGVTRLHAAAQLAGARRAAARNWRGFPFDAVIAAWGYPDGVAAAALAAEHGVPAIVICLGSDVNTLLRHPAIAASMRRGLRSAYRIVTVSHALKDRMVEAGFKRDSILVQHNAVDGEAFTIRDMLESRALLSVPKTDRVICCVARLSYEKGLDLLIDAVGLLVRNGRNDIRLVVVGDGTLAKSLNRRIRRLGLEAAVDMVGAKPPSDIPLWMSAADVVCLPSRREGCPNVLLEALACGKPVVAARVGGVPELLTTANGVLIEPESSEALALGLTQALDKSWDPVALRGAVEYLSWDSVGNRYFNLLHQAIAAAANATVTPAGDRLKIW